MKAIEPCVLIDFRVLPIDDPDYEVRCREHDKNVRRQNRKARRWRFLNRVRNLF